MNSAVYPEMVVEPRKTGRRFSETLEKTNVTSNLDSVAEIPYPDTSKSIESCLSCNRID